MSVPSVILDEYTRTVAPDGTQLLQARVFILDDRFAIYRAVNGKAEMVYHGTVANLERSRHPRRTPHILTTSTDETWDLLRYGCGCGSPIKKITWRNAYKDLAAADAAEDTEPAATEAAG